MKTILILAACALCYSASAQNKIDLSKAPGNTSAISATKKSDAELLRNSKNNTAPTVIEEDELSDRYKADIQSSPNNGFSTTTATQPFNQGNIGNFNFNSAPTNTIHSTQYNQNLGNGVNSQSTIKIDETGKIHSSSTSIKLGK